MTNPGLFMDVRLERGEKLSQEVPRGWNGFCYVYEGAGHIGSAAAMTQHCLVIDDGAPGPLPWLILTPGTTSDPT